ncbi:MAG: pyridoxal phosphate-dependent aminotransferase [Opitutaceae bacterium]|nr:pyridoxal phosphate-dependent aminotransferase [Opitutaceae bacterium]
MTPWSESSRLRAVQTPIIPAIADLIRAHPGTISLGQGVVSYPPPPEAFAAIARFAADPANHKYQPVAGIPALVAAIGQKLAAENDLRVGPAHGNRVMVTAGGNNAFLAALLAIADPGDEVILPVPYYFNHEMAITMANCRPVLVPTDAHCQLDLAALRAAITPRTRAIVTVSPNNPSGAVYPEAALRAVNALCAERGLFHLNDEAYEQFTYDGATHFSPASIPGAAAHTISLFSLSKAFGFASWRIGWMVFPQNLEAALRKVQDTIIICPPVISQHAAVGALAAGAPYVREKLRALAAVRALVQRELASLAADGLAEIPPAAGAFYFLLRLKSSRPPLKIAERLIREHRVAAIPGSAFGLDHGCHLRVAYGALEKATAAEGIGRLARGLRALADNLEHIK